MLNCKRTFAQQDKVVEHKDSIGVSTSSLSKPTTKATESKPLTLTYPAAIMSTTDLILRDPPGREIRPSSSQEDYDTNYMPSSSPIELKSSAQSNDERVPRSMAYKPRTLAPEPSPYGISPSQYGTSPSQYGTSPQSNRSPCDSRRSSILAPDSQGNPIPLDAKWTRIRRGLISLEVLDRDKRRYEA